MGVLRQSVDDLVVQYLPLAYYVSRRWYRKYRWMRDEIVSAATMAVVSAAKNYNPRFGKTFKNYAYQRISGACASACRDGLPKGFRRRASIARLAGYQKPEFISGLEGETSSGKIESSMDFVISSALPVGWEQESVDVVEGMTQSLPYPHREVVRMYFIVAGCTFTKIGERLGCSQAYANILFHAGIEMLREQRKDKSGGCGV